MDFNVDDNGLWVIYSTDFSNHTHVAKVCFIFIDLKDLSVIYGLFQLDASSLDIQYSWNISINHHKVSTYYYFVLSICEVYNN